MMGKGSVVTREGNDGSDSIGSRDGLGPVAPGASRTRESALDGRYGSPNPSYPEETEDIYVVWKWPYAIWGVAMQTRSQYMTQSTLVWILFFLVMLIPIVRFGLPALIVIIVAAALLGALQYIFWKAGREAAEALRRMSAGNREGGRSPPTGDASSETAEWEGGRR